jgi:hypothetical protein
MKTPSKNQHISAAPAVTATEIVMPGVIEPAGLQVRTRPWRRPRPARR